MQLLWISSTIMVLIFLGGAATIVASATVAPVVPAGPAKTTADPAKPPGGNPPGGNPPGGVNPGPGAVAPLPQSNLFLLDLDHATQSYTNTYDEKQPFSRRRTSQVTIWNTQKTSFGFYLEPRNDCQEVWVCSTKYKKLEDVQPPLKDVCLKYIRFRPLEGTATFGLSAGDVNNKGETEFYPWTYVHFKYTKDKYILSVASGERDVAGKVSSRKDRDTEIGGLPLIITSSAYCHPIVVEDSVTGLPVNNVVLGPKDRLKEEEFMEPYPSGRDANTVHEKTTNVLVPTHLTSYTASKKVQCPPLYLAEYETTEDKWTQSTAEKQGAAFMLYEFHRKKHNKETQGCKSYGHGRISFKLVIDDPSRCTWVRLCLMSSKDSEEGKFCHDPKQSVELLVAYKMFVGPDSDEARSMDTDSRNLKIIRFRLAEENKGKSILTMSYGFAGDEGAAEHRMHANNMYPTFIRAHEGGFLVGLVRDRECMARIVTDKLIDQPVVAEVEKDHCLTVMGCQVLVPKEFAPFPGSEYINLDDYTSE